jgi:hypothetical protein
VQIEDLICPEIEILEAGDFNGEESWLSCTFPYGGKCTSQRRTTSSEKVPFQGNVAKLSGMTFSGQAQN